MKTGPEGALEERLDYETSQRLAVELAVRLVTALSGREIGEMKRLADLVLGQFEDSQYPGESKWNETVRVVWTRRFQNILARAAAGEDVTDLLGAAKESTA